MSEFPPPTGRPVAFALRSDPWVELARQQRDRRLARRRRRRIWGSALGIVLVAAGTGAAWKLVPRDAGSVVTVEPTAVTVAAPTTVQQRAEVIALAELVVVDEVWLIDSGNDIFDWGVVLRSRGGDAVGEFSVTARFLGATDDVLDTETRTVARVDDDPTIVGGARRIGGVPMRLDVVVASTGPLTETLVDPATVEVVDLDRIGAGTLDGDDTLIGRIQLGGADDADGADGADGESVGASVNVSAVWRDEAGDVVAAVFVDHDVERDADSGETPAEIPFEIRLRRARVPAGLPSSVSVRWSG